MELNPSPSRPETVARRLEQAIRKGEIKPGDKVPSERELSARWKISRPIVREGISMLVSRGLLTRRQGLGTYLNDASEQLGSPVWADMARRHPNLQGDLLEFRRMLECQAAELAAERLTTADRVRLQQAGAAVEAAWTSDDRKSQIAADLAFHQAIAEATHNPVFSYLMNSLHKLLLDHMQLTAAGTPVRSAVNDQVRSQHGELLKAILAGDPQAAAQAAAAHIDFVRVRLNHMEPAAKRRAKN